MDGWMDGPKEDINITRNNHIMIFVLFSLDFDSVVLQGTDRNSKNKQEFDIV